MPRRRTRPTAPLIATAPRSALKIGTRRCSRSGRGSASAIRPHPLRSALASAIARTWPIDVSHRLVVIFPTRSYYEEYYAWRLEN